MPTLVCTCGLRLNAPGAVPGRVGRCPRCGQTVRVPVAEPAPPEEEQAGYGVAPAAPRKTAFVTAREAPFKEKKVPKQGRALARRPEVAETRLWESLNYPLWDGNGLAILIFLPPVLWLTSLPVLGLIPLFLQGTSGSILVLGACAFPMAFLLVLLMGYVLLFLGRVLESSARGEVRHPRLPDWDFYEVLTGLGRWAWAVATGFLAGGLPAMAYWVGCGDLDLFDRIVLVELLALGAVYSQMALAASLLHEDVWAAHPVTVVRAIRRIGWAYAVPCLVTGLAVALTVAGLAAVQHAPDPWMAAVGLWLFWVFALFAAMVVMRVLGLCYHRHAERLGWFQGRSRRR